MHKNAVTTTTQEKRNGLVTGFILSAIGIIHPKNHFLSSFVQLGVLLSKTKYFLIRQKIKSSRKIN